MALNQKVTDRFAIYQDDCVTVMEDLPKESIHLSVYSPPFGGLYRYTSDERDLSNCHDYEKFWEHYDFVINQIARLTLPGRCTAVHCMDIPSSNSGADYYTDFPGDIIRHHEKHGFHFIARHAIWKEPLWVRNRTMQKNLAHKTSVDDSIYCGVAAADYLLVFRRKGKNQIPVTHPTGFLEYAGDDSKMPNEVRALRGFTGDQKANRFSHWIWRRYASSIWDDIRMGRTVPYIREKDETGENYEKHVHPLQLDVIDRVIEMRSNPGEVVFTPFLGVGSEVYSALQKGRRGIGAELKETYFAQAIINCDNAAAGRKEHESVEDMFGNMDEVTESSDD